MPRLTLESPLGRLTLFEEDGALAALDWGGKRASGEPTPLLRRAKRQLDLYFAGKLTEFDLPLAPRGSAFERRVWRLMAEIPYGETRSYGDLAAALAAAPRAVGQACGRNPLPILIPCHRVLAAGGALGGYSGGRGVDTKRRLLILEGALLV
ncbi:MAG TPA: methylated-DNA--[protein]-cysteine S-methyltransferase [Stellaceae bacterium]|nr:methylated-DNA--[protein]-cysteine S-methyltransferase [Stellaceae bacterium]